MASKKPQKTIVVGAGPVGSVAALYAAQRGDEVEVYELRKDLRDASTVPLNFSKSINLSLAERGINALRKAGRPGLVDSIFADTLPMYARMIHGEKDGKLFQESQRYDVHGRFNRASDRAVMNKRLLDELERMPNVKFYFGHKLVGADFKRKVAWFENKNEYAKQSVGASAEGEVEIPFDFMIGADGAHSAVRYHLMKYVRMNYQQEYIDTLWCEFTMAADTSNGEPDFKLPPDHFHIWPCSTFMFIAIPNPDKTFTCTLFMDASKFEHLNVHPEELIPFFKTNFPGVAGELISEDDIVQQYNENAHLPLISIKCEPYHYGSSVVILGDAAHAMVPFYGQGMNAGLEDVRVLYEFLDAHPGDRAKALAAYTEQRHPDAVAINDLALRNYKEMSHDVKDRTYLLRKWVEERLMLYAPWLGWATQYSRISFGNERYSIVEKLARRQKVIFSWLVRASLGITGSALFLLLRRSNRSQALFGRLWSWVASFRR